MRRNPLEKQIQAVRATLRRLDSQFRGLALAKRMAKVWARIGFSSWLRGLVVESDMRRLALWGFVAALAVTAAGVGCHPKRSSAVLTPDEDRLAVVRRELEARYAENGAGFIARDPDRVMRLRHPDFHTITPDGTVSTREQMYERTRNLIGRIERFDSVTETIISLTLEGDTAHAVVDQRTVRQQRLGDGALHEVRTSVVQRESWVKTSEGWLLWRVDEIQPGETLVDGIPLGKPQARAAEPRAEGSLAHG